MKTEINEDELVDFAILSLKYRTKLTKKFKNRKPYVAPNENHVLNYIPGTIVELFIKEGDVVKAGESILILEAMKMRNLFVMPHDGTIKSINVKLGDKIPKHTVMIEVE